MADEIVVGVDGCRGGWLFVALMDGAFQRATAHPALQDGLDEHRAAAIVAVDMPLGLHDSAWRAADVQGRARLKGRASTLFLTPPRSAVEAATWDEANRLAREVLQSGISRQAFALAPKILELERAAASDARLYEVHPELVFAHLADGPLLESKHTWAGLTHRRALLDAAGVHVPDDLGPLGAKVAPDDVLDAAAAAWTAARIAAGTAASIPAEPELIGGRRVAIWY